MGETLSQPFKPKALVAAAADASRKAERGRKVVKVAAQEWQNRAWTWFDEIGEYRYAVTWVGNQLSKAKLEVRQNGAVIDTGPAYDALMGLFGGPSGHAEMLRQFGTHFTVAGEGWLIGQMAADGSDGEWFVASANEVSRVGAAGTTWKVGERLIENAFVRRMWRPHPRKFDEPDAPSRAVLPILAEIDGLTKHVAAQIDSRLAGAGLLLLPQEISFAGTPTSAPGEDGEPLESVDQASLNGFLQTLMEAMVTPIEDRSDASALVPLLLQLPADQVKAVKHLKFWSELDAQAIELRSEAIRRLALGLDMPPEALLGTSDMNHWGAWQMEEAAIKSHTEPLLNVILQSLTEGFLHPYLESAGVANVGEFQITADTSAMRLRPNRSKEAIELYDRGELKASTALRENGFGEDDAMDDKERQRWLLKKVASGSTTPELVAAALAEMGVVQAELIPEPVETQEARPTPSLTEHPRRQEPDTIEDAVVAAAEIVVFRALERAGNRIKTKRSFTPSGPAFLLYAEVEDLSSVEIDDAMQDAWGMLPHVGLEEHEMALDAYTRRLLRTRDLPSRDALAFYLRGKRGVRG